MSTDLRPAVVAPSGAELDALRDAAGAAIGRRFPLGTTRERTPTTPLDRAAWVALCAELDPIALALDPAHGGEGLGLTHLVAVAAAAGALVVPAPLVETVTLAPLLAAVAPELLPDVVRGTTVVAAVDAEPGADTFSAVTWGADADLLLLVTADGSGDGQVHVHDARAHVRDARIRLRRLDVVDATRPRATVHLDGAAPVARGPVPAALLARTADTALVLTAAAAVGGGRRLLDLAVGYVRVRAQFGRPVGTFQAVQHRIADLHGELESAGAMVERAARSLDRGSDTAHDDALVAMVRAASAGEVVAREGLHLHGGIGFTWEHDAHLYLKRSLADRQLFGGREALLARLADHLST